MEIESFRQIFDELVTQCEAEKTNIGIAHTDKIASVARNLTVAIRRLVRAYDEKAGFAYPFDEITQ